MKNIFQRITRKSTDKYDYTYKEGIFNIIKTYEWMEIYYDDDGNKIRNGGIWYGNYF